MEHDGLCLRGKSDKVPIHLRKTCKGSSKAPVGVFRLKPIPDQMAIGCLSNSWTSTDDIEELKMSSMCRSVACGYDKCWISTGPANGQSATPARAMVQMAGKLMIRTSISQIVSRYVGATKLLMNSPNAGGRFACFHTDAKVLLH